MTNQEMIDEMLQMQRALDEAIYKEHGCEFDNEKCTLAMIDEIGEFNHEIKSTWCWWKYTQKEIDKEKALEELVDIWHFAMSIYYHYYDGREFANKSDLEMSADDDLTMLYFRLINNNSHKFETLKMIGLKFGFTMKDVYEVYKRKNKVNYERIANKY
jgi:dimeric dUTPase (all-alpha-NTP-PPase superfamily)